MTTPEPPPLPPPFPVGACLIYVGERVVSSTPDIRRDSIRLLYPGLPVEVTEVRPGQQGTGEVLWTDDDGEEVVDRTRHGASVWVNALGQRRLIRANAHAGEWVPRWGPYAVGDVVAEDVTFLGIVCAAGPRTFTVLWGNGCQNRYDQDYRGIRRFTIGFWGDRAGELAVLAEHRQALVRWRAERSSSPRKKRA